MFVGGYVCVFETKPCAQGLIFVVNSAFVSYNLCLPGIFAIKDGLKIRQINPSQTLMKLQ